MRRRLVAVCGWAVVLVLLAGPAAIGKDLGTDVLGNISPQSQLGGGGLADRYPLSAFSLDYHTDIGITQLDGVPPTIAQWAAAQIWSLTSFLVKTVIDLFTWAFSLDLLGGTPAAVGGGALAPVASAITSVYENVIGEAWMVVAIVLAGSWGIWKALVQRRYTETAGALALSVVFVLIALFFVYQPERTIGEASRWTNTMSLAFLSGTNRGTVDDPGQAKRHVADQLFGAFVYEPWVVLEFGGLRHCVDTDHLDDDGYPRPVGPHDPARDVCRDHLRQGADGHGGYAPRFLRYPAGSKERNAEYDALRKGEIPADKRDGQFRGYAVDKTDSPAVDIQQEHGAYQRLTLSVVFFVGVLGAVVLLGFLSLAVILAQVVALVLLGFAPVALVIGIFPRAGHDFFRNWLAKLATAVFIKALYSLVIAIVVAVAAALQASTESLGFLFSFGLQAIFFWAIFLYRKQITARLVAATTGAGYDGRMPRMTVVQRAGDVATRPFVALVGMRGRGSREDGGRQESAIAGGPDPATSNGATVAHGLGDHDPDIRPAPVASTNGRSNRHGPLPGRTAGAQATRPPAAANRNGSAPDRDPADPPAVGARPRRSEPEHELSPRASHEDAMRRARELRERQRAANDDRAHRS
jgi:signal transduction histidine kinase